jgi:hypothetical protein
VWWTFFEKANWQGTKQTGKGQTGKRQNNKRYSVATGFTPVAVVQNPLVLGFYTRRGRAMSRRPLYVLRLCAFA